MPSKSAPTRKANLISFRTRSSSSRRDRDTSRYDKSFCISPGPQPRRKPDRLGRQSDRGKFRGRYLQKIDRRCSNRAVARGSMARAGEMRFLVAGACGDLHMFVADASYDVTAEFVAAVFAAGRMAVENPDLTAGPTQRSFFHRHRFGRRIIFSVFRVLHWSRNGSLFAWLSAEQGDRKIYDWRSAHSAQRS